MAGEGERERERERRERVCVTTSSLSHHAFKISRNVLELKKHRQNESREYKERHRKILPKFPRVAVDPRAVV